MVRRTRQQKIANREPLTIQTADVFHRDFTVAPDGTDNRVKFLALEAPESHAQILSVDHEGERSFVHVQNDCNIQKKNRRISPSQTEGDGGWPDRPGLVRSP